MKLPTSKTASENLAVIRQYLVVLSASVSFVIVGTSYAWPSPTLPKLLSGDAPLHLDINQASWVVSLYCLGNLFSPIPAGFLADKIGPQKTLLFTGLLPLISSVLLISITDVVALYAARFLLGMQLGVVSTVLPLYIGEISQPNIRGVLSALINLASNIGMLSVYVIGPFVSYHTLSLLCLLPPLAFISLFFFAPESPFYTMKKQKEEQTKNTLSWLRGNPRGEEVDSEVNQIWETVNSRSCADASIDAIFSSKASRKALLIGVVYSAAKRLSGDGVIRAYATVTLPETTFGVLNPCCCALILGIVTTLSSLLATHVSDLFCRKTLAIASCLGCAFSNLAVAIWFFIDSKSDLDISTINYVPFVGFLLQAVSFNIGCASMVYTVKSEFFPTLVKSKLSAICTITLGVVSFLLNKFYLIVTQWEGEYLNFFVYAVSCFLIVIFIIVYVPETKGRSLQEIQDILNGLVETQCKQLWEEKRIESKQYSV